MTLDKIAQLLQGEAATPSEMAALLTKARPELVLLDQERQQARG